MKHVEEEEKKLTENNALEQMKEDSPSMKSQLSQSDIAERIASSHIITDEDVIRIIQELIDGKYNNSIYELWRNIETSDFDVNDFGVCIIVFYLFIVYLFSSSSHFKQVNLPLL